MNWDQSKAENSWSMVDSPIGVGGVVEQIMPPVDACRLRVLSSLRNLNNRIWNRFEAASSIIGAHLGLGKYTVVQVKENKPAQIANMMARADEVLTDFVQAHCNLSQCETKLFDELSNMRIKWESDHDTDISPSLGSGGAGNDNG